ncbi:MAG: VCBS repeat-containing protein [Pirellulales bacterium]|nr:VCBS repeat-containing protein [Pirellulales bacterium]
MRKTILSITDFRTLATIMQHKRISTTHACSWLLLILFVAAGMCPAEAEPWARHVVDDSSDGADGVRLLDVNGDGRLDCCTPWEEGGLIRVYLNPGPRKCREPWPAVTVGKVASPEDAVFCDVDGDGCVDVVSCCEGKDRSVYVHWAPKDRESYLDGQAWRTDAVRCVQGKQMWMFCVPMDVDGKNGVDLVVGSKKKGGSIGWLESPPNARDMAAWRFHSLSPAGWIMSLETVDMDSDGDLDVLLSDRKGKMRGVRWIENPGPVAASGQPWKNHFVGGRKHTVMFLDVGDVDGDGVHEIVAATRNGRILLLRRNLSTTGEWHTVEIDNPFGCPSGKAVRVADVNLDGRMDLVHTSNKHKPSEYPAVSWLDLKSLSADRVEVATHDIGGREGIKFDLIQMIDLDGDGDLDLLTCEERDDLGVVWYENPTRGPASPSAGPEAQEAEKRRPLGKPGP